MNKEKEIEERDMFGRTREEKYRQELNIPKDKEPFDFSYTVPELDWYREIKVEIKPTDYYYFKLERRYSDSWWLIGENPIKDYPYWKKNEIGKLSLLDLNRFIKWATDEYGCRIIEINVISSSFNIFNEIKKLIGE